MAKYCEICHKGTMSGNRVSHAHNMNKRSWAPNVQKIKVNENGTVTSKHVCTRCIRSNKVQKAI